MEHSAAGSIIRKWKVPNGAPGLRNDQWQQQQQDGRRDYPGYRQPGRKQHKCHGDDHRIK
jgi:hypothetical protein